MFDALCVKVTTDSLNSLVEYVRNNWICGTVWTPDSWNVFNEAVRTNSDVEGWHGMLNRYAKKANLSFYNLVRARAFMALCIWWTRTLCIRRTLCRCDDWYTNGHFCCFDCLSTVFGTRLVQSW